VLLQVRGLTVDYGAIRALHGISFEVQEGEIVTLVGANGAGKSTTLRALSGLVQPTAGEVCFDGQRIDGRPGHKIARLGLVQVPEGRRPFMDMTVRENLQLGAFNRSRAESRDAMERVFHSFPPGG
jgi:branched-chain amino acid transport system ATP-binding protein